MTHEAVFSFTYDSSAQAARVADSVAPELGKIGDERSNVSCHRDGSDLELRIEARDPVALRAAVNTWCSLVSVAESAGQVG